MKKLVMAVMAMALIGMTGCGSQDTSVNTGFAPYETETILTETILVEDIEVETIIVEDIEVEDNITYWEDVVTYW